MSSLEEKSTDYLWGLLFNGTAGPVQLDVWKLLAKRAKEKPEEVSSTFNDALNKAISTNIPKEVKWGLEKCPLCGNPVLSCGPNWQIEGTGDCDEMFTCTYCAVSYTYEIRGAKGNIMQFSIRIGPEKQWNDKTFFLRIYGVDEQKEFEPIFDILDSEGRWIGSYSIKLNKWRSSDSMKDPSKKSSMELWGEVPSDITSALDSLNADIPELNDLLMVIFS